MSPLKLWDNASKIAKGLTRLVWTSVPSSSFNQEDTPKYPRSDAGQDGDEEDNGDEGEDDQAAAADVEVPETLEEVALVVPARAPTPPAPTGLSTVAPTPQRDSDESGSDDSADAPQAAANVSGAVSDVYQQTPGEGSSSDDSGSSSDDENAATPKKTLSSKSLPNPSKPFPSGASKPHPIAAESGSDTEDEVVPPASGSKTEPKSLASISLPTLGVKAAESIQSQPRSSLSRQVLPETDGDEDSSNDEVEMSDIGQSDEEEKPSSRRDSSRYGRVGAVEYDSDEAEGIIFPGGPSIAASDNEDDAPKRARMLTPTYEAEPETVNGSRSDSPITASLRASQQQQPSPSVEEEIEDAEADGDVTMLAPQDDDDEAVEDDDDIVSLQRRSPESSVIGDYASSTRPEQGSEQEGNSIESASASPDAAVTAAEGVDALDQSDPEEEQEGEVTSYQVPRTSLRELDEEFSASQIPSTFTGAERAARDANALDLGQASQKSQGVPSSSQDKQVAPKSSSPPPAAEKAPAPAPVVERVTRMTRAGSAQAAASTPVPTRTTRSTRSQAAQSSQLAPTQPEQSVEPEASGDSQPEAEQPATLAKKVRGRASVAPSTPLRTSGRLSRKASAQPSQSQPSQAQSEPAAIEEEQPEVASMDVDETVEEGAQGVDATPVTANESVSRRVSLRLCPHSLPGSD